MVNYPYYPVTPQQLYQQRYLATEQPQPQIGIKGRPVTSIDEVRATTIDFDGSVFYFPDVANKRIYTKQINYDGTSTLNIYELKPMINDNQTQYVTRDEFDRLIMQLQQKFAAAEPQGAQQVTQQLADSKKEVAASQPNTLTQQTPQFNF